MCKSRFILFFDVINDLFWSICIKCFVWSNNHKSEITCWKEGTKIQQNKIIIIVSTHTGERWSSHAVKLEYCHTKLIFFCCFIPGAMGDPLSDCSPLISAASSGKLRLVRLLVEGGAQVNACNPRGETALLAACKALRGEPAGPETVKLLSYLLQNKVSLQWVRFFNLISK